MNRTAIITGASGGIGSAIAKKMAANGYSLALLGNQSVESLKKTADDCRFYGNMVTSLSGSLCSGETATSLMTNAINALGHVDCLINCAGISYIGLITDMSDDDWKHIIDSNLSSVFYCCRAVVPSMVNRKQGRILNSSSVWGNTGASCEAAPSRYRPFCRCPRLGGRPSPPRIPPG